MSGGGGLDLDSKLTLSSNLITNQETNTLFTRLVSLIKAYSQPTNSQNADSIKHKNFAESNPVSLSIISGFFNAKAFVEFNQYAHLLHSFCLIIGKLTPSENHAPTLSFDLHNDPFDVSIKDFHYQLQCIADARIAYTFIKNDNVEILSLKTSNVLLHSKLYIVQSPYEQSAIIGSSNFTASGLGLYGDQSNKELNLLCDSKRDTQEALSYFESIRNQSSSCKQAVLETLHTSFFYHSPKDIFAKIFSTLPEQESPTLTESQALQKAVEAFGLYDFQFYASLELISRLKRYGIALLADPVGAGKTLSAIGVASIYNGITIIAPKNLFAQWASYFKPNTNTQYFDFISEMAHRVQILSYHQAQNPDEHQRNRLKSSSLIIIDESHNLRNGEPRTKNLKQNSYQKLKSNLNTNASLLLLSATPINNNFLDLANQFRLKSELIFDSATQTSLAPKDICQNAQKSLESNDSQENLELEDAYYKLTHLIFSRSSEQIVSYLKKLNKDMPKQDITIHSLSSIPPTIDFSFEKLTQLLGLNENLDASQVISFSIYDPYQFLPDDLKTQLSDKQLENLGEYTTPRGFLCMKLFKSLESSLDAFKLTLNKIISYHHNYLNHIAFDVDSKTMQDDLEEPDSLFPKRLVRIKEMGFLDKLSAEFTEVIKRDLTLLERISQKLKDYEPQKDFSACEKYKKLREIIDSIPDIKTQKLLIFSESIPTAKVIKDALKRDYPSYEIETISGEIKTQDFVRIKNRFSPRSLNYTFSPQEKEIDILIASDCLSEGANLQDCQNLLNWDIAFNPVRSIQRIGRIWRIGSIHSTNHITHFFPDTDIDAYIQLESKLKFKIRAAQSASPINDPHAIKAEQAEKERKAFEQKRKIAYESLKNDSISIEEENKFNQFSTLESVLSELSHSFDPTQSPLPNGIFSIAKSPHLAHNHLFAFLQDIQSQTYYCTLFDLNAYKLRSNAQDKGVAILRQLSSLKDIDIKEASLFAPLEDLTNDFTDLACLKNIFANLTESLNNQIQAYERNLAHRKKSDGGLVCKKSRSFALIAWLFINPDFESLRTLRVDNVAHNAKSGDKGGVQ